jgi:LAGLIDADG endonuclease
MVSDEYIAGFFDGEGSVATKRRSLEHGASWGVRLVFYQKTCEVLEQIQEALGCGRLAFAGESYRLIIYRKEDLLNVIPRLHRHSVVKRKQLGHAYKIAQLMGTRGRDRESHALAIRALIRYDKID